MLWFKIWPYFLVPSNFLIFSWIMFTFRWFKSLYKYSLHISLLIFKFLHYFSLQFICWRYLFICPVRLPTLQIFLYAFRMVSFNMVFCPQYFLKLAVRPLTHSDSIFFWQVFNIDYETTLIKRLSLRFRCYQSDQMLWSYPSAFT